eukprot:scaffold137444_cov19-Tisochrysis_lutea.AAC.1
MALKEFGADESYSDASLVARGRQGSKGAVDAAQIIVGKPLCRKHAILMTLQGSAKVSRQRERGRKDAAGGPLYEKHAMLVALAHASASHSQ